MFALFTDALRIFDKRFDVVVYQLVSFGDVLCSEPARVFVSVQVFVGSRKYFTNDSRLASAAAAEPSHGKCRAATLFARCLMRPSSFFFR